MHRRIAICLAVAVALLITGCGLSRSNNSSGGTTPTSGGTSTTSSGSITAVKHVVMLLQENRSFDNYFGHFNAYRTTVGLTANVDDLTNPSTPPAPNPTFDGSTCAGSPAGTCTPFKMVSACIPDLSPSWNESHTQRNLNAPASGSATNDGFAYEAGAYSTNNGYSDRAGARAMGYYDQTQLNYYYFLATQFAVSDKWFSPMLGKSEPNHLYNFAATSQGWIDIPNTQLDAQTIFNLLQNAGVSWKIYYTDLAPGGGPDTYATYFSKLNSLKSNIVPLSQYFADLQSGNLPAVALIDAGRDSGTDEHPNNNVQTGAQQAQKVIDALISSSSWSSSVFFLTWDEAGGMYDHVPPAAAVNPDGIAPNPAPFPYIKSTFNDNFTYTGFRVPLIVISPFAKKGYVSHTTADYTAMLKFIETRFSLPSLTQRDAAQFDMTEFFNFGAPPNATPPTPPAQSVNAACYYDRVP